MNYIKHFLAIFIILLLAVSVPAQQGIVTSGGEATGAGGSLSFSTGQVDYLIFSSEQGSLNFGLQQSWQTSEDPPLMLEVSDMVISASEELCFNAVETITVAGDGNQFIVQAYGHADLIAGQSILLKYGTLVEPNGSLHARISNSWCPPQESLLASFSEPNPSQHVFEPETHSTFFKVYPNPTTGNFTLELFEFEEDSGIELEIYSALGHLVLSKYMPAHKLYNLNIAGRQPGIYLIRVLKDKEIGSGKIIKQ